MLLEALYKGLVGLTAAFLVTMIFYGPVLLYRFGKWGIGKLKEQPGKAPMSEVAPVEAQADSVSTRVAEKTPLRPKGGSGTYGLGAVVAAAIVGVAVGGGGGWFGGSAYTKAKHDAQEALLAEAAASIRTAAPPPPTPEQVAAIRVDGPSRVSGNTCSIPIWNGSDYAFNKLRARMEWTIRHRSDRRVERRVTEAFIAGSSFGWFEPGMGSSLVSDDLFQSGSAVDFTVVSCRPASFQGIAYPSGDDAG